MAGHMSGSRLLALAGVCRTIRTLPSVVRANQLDGIGIHSLPRGRDEHHESRPDRREERSMGE